MAIARFRPFSSNLDPFRDLTDIQSEMNRLFDGFFGRPSAAERRSASGRPPWTCTRPRTSSSFPPSCPA